MTDSIQVLKALYFPYSSPNSYETILRSLLLYEAIGAIVPKGIFLPEGRPRESLATNLELIAQACEKYGRKNVITPLDPADLIKRNEEEFTESVVSDLSNPVFGANAPKGEMNLYADKINRVLFERFRSKIGVSEQSATSLKYDEGPYRGTEHFIWPVKEPLAHSIILNLTLLGCRETDAVPITDSKPSHTAMLFKMSCADRQYEAHVAAGDLVKLALPVLRVSDIRKILDFRDKHKREMQAFWRALAADQRRLADILSSGPSLFIEAKSEYENLKKSVKESQRELKWSVVTSLMTLGMGLAGRDPMAIVASPIPTIIAGVRYAGLERRSGVNGISYLLHAEKQLGARR